MAKKAEKVIRSAVLNDKEPVKQIKPGLYESVSTCDCGSSQLEVIVPTRGWVGKRIATFVRCAGCEFVRGAVLVEIE